MVQAANIGFRGQPVQGILFKVSGSGLELPTAYWFRVSGSRFRVGTAYCLPPNGSGFRVSRSFACFALIRVKDSGFRVQGFGFKVPRFPHVRGNSRPSLNFAFQVSGSRPRHNARLPARQGGVVQKIRVFRNASRRQVYLPAATCSAFVFIKSPPENANSNASK